MNTKQTSEAILFAIPSGADAAPLSPIQKKFNSLLQRIRKQREVLNDWELARSACGQRYSEEVLPAQRQLHQSLVALLLQLDAKAGTKLAKADKEFLSEYISDMAWDALQETEDAAEQAMLKDIFTRHCGEDYDADMQAQQLQEKQMLQNMVRNLFDVEVGLDELDNPDAMIAKLEQEMQARMQSGSAAPLDSESAPDFAQEQGRPKRGRKKPSTRELKAQEEAKQTSLSVREIYRKLASELHPDRAADGMERERKTALMQRVNQAYAANDLLQLLELQIECEQIDAADLASVSAERMQHYIKVLNAQLASLKQAAVEQEMAAAMDFHLPLRQSYTPKKLLKFFADEIKHMRTESTRLQEVVELIEQPQHFKAWLKQERITQRSMEMERYIHAQLDPYFYRG